MIFAYFWNSEVMNAPNRPQYAEVYYAAIAPRESLEEP